MAILGIAIQSTTGIPLYLQTWSEKLSGFQEGSPILISGFLSAVSSFANNFKQNISFIRLSPSDYDDPFGIDAVYSFIGAYMILVFMDPYQFREKVQYKIDWLYAKVFAKYEEGIRLGRVPQLNEAEHNFIHDVLQDTVAWNTIYAKKDEIDVVCDHLMEIEFPDDVYGVFVTSFDNSILYTYGIDREEVEIYMNNIGSRGHGLEDGEVLHNYVSLPGLEPRLMLMTNPGIKIEIADILGDDLVGQGGVPFYYYMVADANCAIGPIVESLTVKLNAILLG
ncbi:MAG: hypothetical protein ACTSRS_17545 [Candidatus Helarchaeota archaeon]